MLPNSPRKSEQNHVEIDDFDFLFKSTAISGPLSFCMAFSLNFDLYFSYFGWKSRSWKEYPHQPTISVFPHFSLNGSFFRTVLREICPLFSISYHFRITVIQLASLDGLGSLRREPLCQKHVLRGVKTNNWRRVCYTHY
jgi:hypothetical protein